MTASADAAKQREAMAARLKEAREYLGLSQDDVATALGGFFHRHARVCLGSGDADVGLHDGQPIARERLVGHRGELVADAGGVGRGVADEEGAVGAQALGQQPQVGVGEIGSKLLVEQAQGVGGVGGTSIPGALVRGGLL